MKKYLGAFIVATAALVAASISSFQLPWEPYRSFGHFVLAQGNPTCPTRPVSDSTNACASTAFVQTAIGSSSTPMYASRAVAIATSIPTQITYLLLGGYSSAGDSGQGAFYIVQSCPVVTAPDFQDAGGRCWHLKVLTPIMGMFGTDPTGVTTVTTQVQNFVNYTISNGLCGKFGKGIFTINGEIDFNSALNPGNGFCFDGEGHISFSGLGPTTCFNNTNLTSHTFVLNTGAFGTNGGRLTNFAFCHATLKTGGWNIVQSGANNLNAGFELSNILFGLGGGGGIRLITAFNCKISNIWNYGVGADLSGIEFDGAGPSTGINGCAVNNVWILQAAGAAGPPPGTTTTALRIRQYVAGVTFTDCHLQGGNPAMNYGIWVGGPLGVDYIQGNNCYADAFAGNLLRVDGGTNVSFRGSNFMNSYAGFSCVRIGAGEVALHDNDIFGCLRHGVEVLGGDMHIFTNNRFRWNGFEGAGINNYDDIFVTGGVSNFIIDANNFCSQTPNPDGVSPVAVRFNVNVAPGASNNYTVTNNNMGATAAAYPGCHRTGGLQDAGTGTTKNISGNAGSAWTAYTPTVTCGVGTPTTITALGRHEIAGPRVTVNLQAVLTDIGSCTTSLRLSLPVTAASPSAVLNAINATTFTDKSAFAVAGVPRVDIFATGLVFPGVNGDTINITGVYEAVAP